MSELSMGRHVYHTPSLGHPSRCSKRSYQAFLPSSLVACQVAIHTGSDALVFQLLHSQLMVGVELLASTDGFSTALHYRTPNCHKHVRQASSFISNNFFP